MTVASLLLAVEGVAIGVSGLVLVYAAVAYRADLLYSTAIALTGGALVVSAASVVAVALLPGATGTLSYALVFVGSVGHLLAGWRLSRADAATDSVLIETSERPTDGGFEEAP